MNFISEFKHFSSFKKLFPRLSIRKKVILGYSLSLGISILGTSGGLLVGNSYFQAAREKTILVNEEDILLGNLQTQILQVLIDKQEIIALIDQPENLSQEITQFNIEINKLEVQFTKFKNFTEIQKNSDLYNWTQKYQKNIKNHIQLLKELIEKVAQLDSQSNKILAKQELFLKFYQVENADEFSDFAHSIERIREIIKENQKQANLAYNHALIVQAVVIIMSMAISILIASLFALYTSKIITQPILEVTNLAEKVTNEENFDLQISVNTQDEIGNLANSLNLLIKQVKHLLEIQQIESQAKLIQNEKMSSLGIMLAGVAHEINNPVNFISGNLIHAHNYFDDLLTLLKTYKSEIPEPPPQVQAVAKEINLEFLEKDIPKLFQSMEIGVERTKEIVLSLKDFVRVDQKESNPLDIHSCLDSTLLILNSRLKNIISVIKNYGDIPKIDGYTGLIYQVFMNLLSNAIDAVEEKTHQHPDFVPIINITTEVQENNWVVIRIADNGSGISLANQQKIFENFFTTKPRGIGTGLGLAITRDIIVNKHQGKINFNSESNQGTTFTIHLPILHSSII
jgi:two-component system, NtrC family, sensor kinase